MDEPHKITQRDVPREREVRVHRTGYTEVWPRRSETALRGSNERVRGFSTTGNGRRGRSEHMPGPRGRMGPGAFWESERECGWSRTRERGWSGMQGP